ncbi:hypothetical protein HanPI659440_Chr03g0095181 [Helianthus annuus]|nr:hypothetical protein HanPI659440_Chr03g0095181 [Helianthus annuus]
MGFCSRKLCFGVLVIADETQIKGFCFNYLLGSNFCVSLWNLEVSGQTNLKWYYWYSVSDLWFLKTADLILVEYICTRFEVGVVRTGTSYWFLLIDSYSLSVAPIE